VRILFTITLFLSSLLLFLIEPMIAKMILPRFGGSPGVWNTSMLFFQAALLAGYGYAHLATRWLGPRVQALTHVVVLLLPLLVLPFALPAGIQSGSGNPAPLVLLILTISVGLPFLTVSAGAPLLQRWFAATDDPHAKDPYFLYSASNLGSMIALLAYPFLIEPTYRLSEQARLWTYGYYALVPLMAICAIGLWTNRGKAAPVAETAEPEEQAVDDPITAKQRLLWIALAFCPSSLLLGITTYLTSNIAPMPLLWVVPLAIYLATFILAFARKQVLTTRLLGRTLPLLLIPLAFTIILESSDPRIILYLILLHLLTFFVAAMLCHTELASRRPSSKHLTEFFFYVSLGGVLGGIFNALIAPTVFNSYFEYPLVLAAACFFRPRAEGWKFSRMDWIYPAAFAAVTVALSFLGRALYPEPTGMRSAITIGIPLLLVFISVDSPIRFGSTLALLFAVTSVMQVSVAGHIIEAKRSFFGVHRIEVYSNEHGLFRVLVHGNTVHGKENFGDEAGVPLTYYYPTGPIGEVFATLGPTRHNVALVGLGIGSLAGYGRPGQKFTYYEIDPGVVALATNPKFFQFVSNCKAQLEIKLGDARLELAKAPASGYDLIVLDAFSSDSIPMHLLTREAAQMYLTKLMPGGVLAFHISNRYLDLQPVLANEAAALGLRAWIYDDQDIDPNVDGRKAKYASIWVVMARKESDIGELRRHNPGWQPMEADGLMPLWTDDYSNIASLLKIGRHAGE
jgi:hypothetical protein